jgi:hypothetical protein
MSMSNALVDGWSGIDLGVGPDWHVVSANSNAVVATGPGQNWTITTTAAGTAAGANLPGTVTILPTIPTQIQDPWRDDGLSRTEPVQIPDDSDELKRLLIGMEISNHMVQFDLVQRMRILKAALLDIYERLEDREMREDD